MMALNAEIENATRMALNTDIEKWWLWIPNEDAMMALNAKNEKWWLWTPNWKCGMVTPNVVNREWTVALYAKWNIAWLWTSNEDVDLNAKQKQNTALNTKLKLITMSVKLRKITPSVIDEKTWWLWTSSWEMINGSERQNETTMPLNAEMKRRLWTPNQKKHRWMSIWNKSSACPTKLVTRNVMLRKTTLNIVNEKTRWLWKPSRKGIMALNAKTGEMALNAKWGWTTALNAEWKN